MQFSEMKSTMPLAYLTTAPGEGQALRQPGSSQCMQPSLRISHSIEPSSFAISENRMTVHDWSVRSIGLSYTPTLVPISSRRSFHCMHATWQALQPMHFEMSISLATGASAPRTCGAAVVVAERFWISSDCIVCPPLRLLDVDQERLELRRLRVRVGDVRRQVVREVAGLGHADEAPVDRYAHRVDLLALALEVREPLGDHGGRLQL